MDCVGSDEGFSGLSSIGSKHFGLGFKKTDPCPTLVTIPASVVLGQTMSALVGYQKLGSAGAPALVAGEWRTPLKHTPPRMLSH